MPALPHVRGLWVGLLPDEPSISCFCQVKLGSCPSFPQLEIQLPAFLLCRELLGGLSVLLSVGCLETDVLDRAGVQARNVVPPWVPSAGERWEVLIPAWSCLLSDGMWVEFSAHELSLPFSHILST